MRKYTTENAALRRGKLPLHSEQAEAAEGIRSALAGTKRSSSDEQCLAAMPPHSPCLSPDTPIPRKDAAASLTCDPVFWAAEKG